MTNPNAEAQRRWRERQKQKRQEALKTPDTPIDEGLYQTPFCDSRELEVNWFNFALPLDLAGIDPPDFGDDSGPRSLTGDHERTALDAGNDPYEGPQNSLAKAEVVIGCLIDAAAELAIMVNSYKCREISHRIAEFEASDLTDPKVRKDALDKIVRLTRLRERLEKQIRWPFRQWKTDQT